MHTQVFWWININKDINTQNLQRQTWVCRRDCRSRRAAWTFSFRPEIVMVTDLSLLILREIVVKLTSAILLKMDWDFPKESCSFSSSLAIVKTYTVEMLRNVVNLTPKLKIIYLSNLRRTYATNSPRSFQGVSEQFLNIIQFRQQGESLVVSGDCVSVGVRVHGQNSSSGPLKNCKKQRH